MTAQRGGSKPLKDGVAVVAGATRGAGRGIASMLGEAGAKGTAQGAAVGHDATLQSPMFPAAQKRSRKLKRGFRKSRARRHSPESAPRKARDFPWLPFTPKYQDRNRNTFSSPELGRLTGAKL
jgi:hypothetical protein